MNWRQFLEAAGYVFKDALASIPVTAGVIAMANAGPDSNGSQFFLTLAPAPFLNGKHTVFGVVVGGLEAARAVSRAPRVRLDPASGRELDRPVEPEVLEAVRIEER